MTDKLSDYHRMRDFGVTPEPKGKVAPKGKQLRFVVQKHHARNLHYDFRLELDGTLKSWAIPKGPSLDPAVKRLAVHVEDHPLDYANFEGSIPEHQYGAGTVIVWDNGTWIPDGDPDAGYAAGKLKFHLNGKKLQGGWTLVRARLPGSSSKEQWLLIKERDEHARPTSEFDITAALPDSVLSSVQDVHSTSEPQTAISAKKKKHATTAKKPRTSSEDDALSSLEGSIEAPMPSTLKPQLATLVDAIPKDHGWQYEIKFDGYRILSRIDGDEITLWTRAGNDWTAKMPRLVQELKHLGLERAWLDGEIVLLDSHGLPSFQLLQNAFDTNSTADIVYFVFDVPYLNGYDLRNVALASRHTILQHVLEQRESNTLRLSTVMTDSARDVLDGACRLSMEGIIGKRTDSRYQSGRSTSWIKIKCDTRQEFVIIGYTEPQGARSHFGALLLAVYDDDGELQYAGRVGTGFNGALLESIYKELQPIVTTTSPLKVKPTDLGRVSVHWVKPVLVAEVAFTQWTSDGLLRQASFQGMRKDKPATEIKRERAIAVTNSGSDGKPDAGKRSPSTSLNKAIGNEVASVTITHPDRILDPSTQLTKLDMARYYEAIAPHILPYLKNRPVYLLRTPDGIEGEQFFQKHVEHMSIPGMRNLDPSLDPDHAPLMAIDNETALIGAVQMGTIELHTCNATADKIDRPDCMIFDLDPDPALPWEKLIKAVQLTKILLDELGLVTFIKTSGGKGFHLVIPLARRHDWDTVGAFSLAIAQHLAKTIPTLFSAKMGAKNRIGKVFVDTLRNRRQASTVCAYSARARPGLGASTPIEWAELTEIKSAAQWTIQTLPQRLAQMKNDPWRELTSSRQTLTAAMKKQLNMQM